MNRTPLANEAFAKDVFISYRRKDGATAARLLCDALERRGISVFFDRESIGAENFDDAIRKHLEISPNLIAIISPEMFSRGRILSGGYDEAAVAQDWVYEELRIALNMDKKNIIPVFVNGVDGFPADLPPSISEISRRDALKLNHEHFDVELLKLIGRLKTRRQELLEKYVEVCGDDASDGTHSASSDDSVWNDLLRVCGSLSLDAKIEIQRNLVQTIKNLWVRKSSQSNSRETDREVLDVLLEREPLNYVKLLCRALGVDWRGCSPRLKENLIGYLHGDPRVLRRYDEDNNDDRIFQIIGAFSRVFRSVADRRNIHSAIEQSRLNVVFDNRRSSEEIFVDTFLHVDVEDLLEELDFSEQLIKKVCEEIFHGDSRGRKNELIARICNFSNYRDVVDDGYSTIHDGAP